MAYVYNETIFDKIKERLTAMLIMYTRINVFRFDLRYPIYGKVESTDISNFLKRVNYYLTQQGICYHYVWVREHDTSSHHHYHLVFCVANTHITAEEIMYNFSLIWSHLTDSNISCLHMCENYRGNYDTVLDMTRDTLKKELDFKRNFVDLLLRLQYLAKYETKNRTPFNKRSFSCSHMSDYEKQIVVQCGGLL